MTMHSQPVNSQPVNMSIYTKRSCLIARFQRVASESSKCTSFFKIYFGQLLRCIYLLVKNTSMSTMKTYAGNVKTVKDKQ